MPQGTILALILLGFALRVLRLDFQPLWWDEGYSVWFATHPLGQMAALTAQDIHPPLYYALLHGWTLLLGTAPIVLRLLSVVAGTLMIPAIYLAGRRLLGKRAALLAALLVAISPLAVFYSQEIRMYGLVALLSTGILLVAWRMLGSPMTGQPGQARESGGEGDGRPALVRDSGWGPRKWDLALYVLLTTAALYTQYYVVFLPVGLTLFALWQWWRGRGAPGSGKALGYWLGAQAAVALLYLPWVIYAGPKLVPYVSQKVVQDADRPLGLLIYLGRHLSAFSAGHLEGPLAPYWPAVLLLLIPATVGLVWAMRSGSRGSGTRDQGSAVANSRSPVADSHSPFLMLLLVLASALLLGWLVGLRYPFFPERGERLLLLAMPAFLLLFAAGLDGFLSRARAAGLAVLGLSAAVSIASLAVFYVTPRYAEDDYRPLIARIVEQGLPEDTVFASYPWQAGYWRAYGDPNGPVDVLTPDVAWGAPVAAALQEALDRGRVWFPAHLSLGAILESRIEDYLGAHAVSFVNEWHGPNTRLSAWAELPPAAAADLAPVRFSLPGPGAGTIELSGAGAQEAPVPAANVVMPLSLTWTGEARPPELVVSVRLTDDLGQIWAQHDYEPLGGSVWRSGANAWACDVCAEKFKTRPWQATDRLGVLVPAGTPPGRYHVEVVVHPKDEERPLDVVGDSDRESGSSARLFDVTVGPAGAAMGIEHLPISIPQRVDMQGGLRLLGYSLDDAPATPGDLRKLSLFWQATDQPASEYTAFVQLLDRQGGVAAGWEAPPGAGYPTQLWAPGELIRTQASMRVPASLADGSYELIGGLFRADDKTRLLTSRGADHFSLGQLRVRGRAHDMNPPIPEHAGESQFGELARLVGYDFAPPPEGAPPGSSLPLILYWQALGASGRPYTVFVHLIDEAGHAAGFGDGEPAGGKLATTGWVAGEYLADPHEIAIQADAPAGTYRVAIGLYDSATGERLRTPDGAETVMLEPPVVVP
jgi:4-amino-4-deoxy-L-arabinose transferase-like glycosyltransferase